MLPQPILEVVLAVILQEIVSGIDGPTGGEHQVLLGLLLIPRAASAKDPQNIMRIESTMPQPAIHEIHPPVEIDTGGVRAAGPHQLQELKLEVRGQPLISIQPKNPGPIKRDIVQGPVELDSLIDELVLVNAATECFTNLQGGVGAERIHDNDVIREVLDGFQTALDVLFLVVGENNQREQGSPLPEIVMTHAWWRPHQHRLPRTDSWSMEVWHKRIESWQQTRKLQTHGGPYSARTNIGLLSEAWPDIDTE